MNLEQMAQFEREQMLLAQSRQARREAHKAVEEAQDLPGVRSSGKVVKMTPEEKKAWFDEMRTVATGHPSRETDAARERREKDEAQKKGNK